MTDRGEDGAPGGDDDADDGTLAVGNDEPSSDRGDDDAVRVYGLDPDESVSTGVVTAVADATGRPIASLEPLANAVDTDALEALVDNVGRSEVRLSFEYAGVTVTVDSTRTVVVQR